jgi:hypothetical protein
LRSDNSVASASITADGRKGPAKLIVSGTPGDVLLREAEGVMHLLIGPRNLGSQSSSIEHIVESKPGGTWSVAAKIRMQAHERCLGFDAISFGDSVIVAYVVRWTEKEQEHTERDFLELRVATLGIGASEPTEIILDHVPDVESRYQLYPVAGVMGDTLRVVWVAGLYAGDEVRLYAVPLVPGDSGPRKVRIVASALTQNDHTRDVRWVPCGKVERVILGGGILKSVAFLADGAIEKQEVAVPKDMQNGWAARAVSTTSDAAHITWIDTRRRSELAWFLGLFFRLSDNFSGVPPDRGDVEVLRKRDLCNGSIRNLEPVNLGAPGLGATSVATDTDGSITYVVCSWIESARDDSHDYPPNSRMPYLSLVYEAPAQR